MVKGAAGFEEWSGLVRQAVLWAGARGYTAEAGIGAIADPATSIIAHDVMVDPETEAWGQVLVGLSGALVGDAFQAREVLKLYQAGERSANPELIQIREGLVTLLGNKVEMTQTRIGHALKNRRDKIVDGLVVRASGKGGNGAMRWRIERAG